MKMVTKHNRMSLGALEKSGHHNQSRKEQEVSGVVHSARLCVICQHSSSGTCQIQILRIVQTFRQRISHHPEALVTYDTAINSKNSTIKLHSAYYWESAGLARCYLERRLDCSTNTKATIFIVCSIFGLGNDFAIKSAGLTFVSTFFVTNLLDLKVSCIHKCCMSTCFNLSNPLRLIKHTVVMTSRCRFNPHTMPRSFVTL